MVIIIKLFSPNCPRILQINLFIILLLTCILSCVGAQSNKQADSKSLSVDAYKEFSQKTQETDKSPNNDIWYGSIYRNTKYNLRIQFPESWEIDKGMSINTLVRAIDREYGVTLSVAIQHLPIEVPDDTNIFTSYSIEEFKSLFSQIIERTNKTQVEQLDIEKGYLNNLPAYVVTATYDQASLDQRLTFILRQVQCLKNSKYYNVQMVMPLDFYDESYETVFRTFVDSFKFEFE